MTKPILEQMAEALEEARDILVNQPHRLHNKLINDSTAILITHQDQKADWVMVRRERYYQGRELIKELRRKLKHYARRPKDSKEHYPAIQEIFDEVEAYLTKPDGEEE